MKELACRRLQKRTLQNMETLLWASAMRICYDWLQDCDPSLKGMKKNCEEQYGYLVSCEIGNRTKEELPLVKLKGFLPMLASSKAAIGQGKQWNPSLEVLVSIPTTLSQRTMLMESMVKLVSNSGADLSLTWKGRICQPSV